MTKSISSVQCVLAQHCNHAASLEVSRIHQSKHGTFTILAQSSISLPLSDSAHGLDIEEKGSAFGRGILQTGTIQGDSFFKTFVSAAHSALLPSLATSVRRYSHVGQHRPRTSVENGTVHTTRYDYYTWTPFLTSPHFFVLSIYFTRLTIVYAQD